MGFWRNTWRALGHISLVHWILGLLGLTSVAALSIYLATLTDVFRLFAPFSYLVAAFVGLLGAIALFTSGIEARRRITGTKPRPRVRTSPEPPANAPLADVVSYIKTEAAFGERLAGKEEGETILALEREIMDRVSEQYMHVWGRQSHLPLRRIGLMGGWQYCRVDSQGLAITLNPPVLGGHSVLYFDIHFNWGEVRKAWPKAAWWRRLNLRAIR